MTKQLQSEPRSSMFAMLGVILAALSVVAVIKFGFEFGLSKSVGTLLDYYERLVHVMLGWAEAPIASLLASASPILGWEPQLYPHWKHVLLLSFLLCAGPARVAWDSGESGWAVLLYSVGLLASIVGAIVAGTFPLPAQNFIGLYTLPAIPALAIAPSIFLGSLFADRNSAHSLSRRAGRALLWTVSLSGTCFGAVFGVLQTPSADGPDIWTILGVVSVPALLALAMIWRAVERASDSEGTWWHTVSTDVWARVGWNIMATLTGLAVFIATNAALAELGL